MGGLGSGAARRKDIKLICVWEECKEEYYGKRKDRLFCSQSCRDAYYVRKKLIESKEFIKCRICNTPISILKIKEHFLLHNINI